LPKALPRRSARAAVTPSPSTAAPPPEAARTLRSGSNAVLEPSELLVESEEESNQPPPKRSKTSKTNAGGSVMHAGGADAAVAAAWKKKGGAARGRAGNRQHEGTDTGSHSAPGAVGGDGPPRSTASSKEPIGSLDDMGRGKEDGLYCEVIAAGVDAPVSPRKKAKSDTSPKVKDGARSPAVRAARAPKAVDSDYDTEEEKEREFFVEYAAVGRSTCRRCDEM
jgi:hypothetical protein